LWNQTSSKRKKKKEERIQEPSNSSKALTQPLLLFSLSLCLSPSSLNEAEVKMCEKEKVEEGAHTVICTIAM